jgi:hypothetical protein
MTLGKKQRYFTKLVGNLILWAYKNGYELTFGETYRTPEQAALNAKSGKGISRSLHIQRLAVDLNLFIDGAYMTKSEDYKPLGDYWKSLDPLCRWGGDFKDGAGRPKPDGNHFSLEHEGIK